MAKLNSSTVKWLTCFLIPLTIFCIPLSEVYTPHLRLFFSITIFAILLVGFELLPLLVASIFIPTAYLLSGLVDSTVAFSVFTGDTVWMILGLLILAEVLDKIGLLERISLFCISKCGGSYTGVIYGILFTGFVLNIATFGNAYIIMVMVSYGVVKTLDLPIGKESALIGFAGFMGGMSWSCTFYDAVRNSLVETNIRTIMPDFTIQWYDMAVYNGLLGLFLLVLVAFLIKLFPCEHEVLKRGKEYFTNRYKDLGAMSKDQRIVSVVVSLMMIYLFTSSLTGLKPAYAFMTLPYLLFLPGINVANEGTVKKVNFSMILFVAGCLTIGNVGNALGISKLITTTVTPMLAGHHHVVALGALNIVGVIANLFMTPYALAAALSAPFAQIAMELGMNPLSGVMPLILAGDQVIFPHESAPSVFLYSVGIIKMKDFIVIGTIKTVATFLFLLIGLYPFWKFTGLL
ncbi:SLC13 family permease [Desulfovibrio litoralis]|uniref:Di-and tricarboxylate transporter n=1 Tax=Desulfovibrio litoralis DSM 11393 TaxID=1121455 RepID=A0A1M7SPM0_9BACT|nr:SLC13 family permease [Desulfovibrio litoralis]SHN60402.1 Di-and tricarboxylate transporter [Desulfovibrio litoralis DSM 11393]